MKTPKEKAKELVEKFLLIENEYKEHISFEEAKQGALIAVEEIMEAIGFVGGLFDDEYELAMKYWKEVKTEIENYDLN